MYIYYIYIYYRDIECYNPHHGDEFHRNCWAEAP